MPRNLILCCDGTNNKFGPENTNVVRLVQVLERDPDKQRLYYDPGVGTLPEPGVVTWLGKKISDICGLAFGAGLTWKVQEAYCYLMEMWEPGDRVFLFGFSRGSYSVRVLAGMLHTVGLLPRGNSNLVPYAFRLYEEVRNERKNKLAGKPGPWENLCNDFRWTFSRTAFQGDDERHFPVHFLGVWDTVSSVGWVWNPESFPYTACNPSIEIIRHAVSVDERRCFFRQNLMRKAPGNVTGTTREQDLKQYWFSGVHCDVGGGYPEIYSENPKIYSGLWREAFEWMLDEARKPEAGLLVIEDRLKKVLERDPPCDFPWKEVQHESLAGAWWIAEYFPKRVWLSDQKRHALQLGLGRHRVIPDQELIYKSVLNRIRETDYSPPNFTPAFLGKIRALPEVPEVLPFEAVPSLSPSPDRALSLDSNVVTATQTLMKIHDIAYHDVGIFPSYQLESSLTSDKTLVVPDYTPALEAISQAAAKDARLIIVTDVQSQITGLLAPGIWKTKIESYRGVPFDDLHAAVQTLTVDPLEIARGFHHEWFNTDRPELYWCPAGHLTDESPCSLHP